jgi:hypothetical protein
MTKKSGITKSRKQDLAKVLKLMDSWMKHRTRLTLFFNMPSFPLFLRGRMVGRQEGLFLFDSHGEDCRVPLVPERYDRAVCDQEDPASVTLENTSGMQADLRIAEDAQDASFPEMCADWVLQKMVDGADSSEVAEQEMTRLRKCFDEIAVGGCSNNPVPVERVGR